MTFHLPALIVGAGISGLTCAYALRKSGVDAHVFEASRRPGGYIHSKIREGFLLESGPQSFSLTAQLHELCRDLQIENELLQAPPRAPRYVLINGKLTPVPLSPPSMLFSSLLSPATKFSFLRDLLGNSHPPEHDESVAAFVRRKFSAQLLDRLVGPFVSGIYAGDTEQLSLRSAFPALYDAEKSAGSVIRGMMRAAKTKPKPHHKPTLATFRQGNQTLTDAIANYLGEALHTGCQVTHIEPLGQPNNQKFAVSVRTGTQDSPIEADQLILATPTNVAGELLHNTNSQLTALLKDIPYAPIAVVSLGYSRKNIGRSLEGFGFLVPRSAGLRTLGTVWNSSLFPDRAPEGSVLLTSFVGGATDPQAATLSANELSSLVHHEISPILKLSAEPQLSHVTIHSRALPQYNLGHTERMAALQNFYRDLPNLWLVGNYLRGPSIGSCIEQALAVAGEIRGQLQH